MLNDRLRDRLVELEQEYESVLAELNDPDLSSDPRRLREVSRRHRELDEIVRCFRSLESAAADLEAAREMVTDSAGGERELAQAEVAQAEGDVDRLEEELRLLLVPRDPNAGRNVIMEIRGAEGGEEANLFAKDLYEMYSRYAAPRAGRSRSSRRARQNVTDSTRSPSWSRARTPGCGSSTRADPTGSSGCRSPSPRAGSTPRRPPWRCCPRPRRSTSTSTPRT